MSTKLNKKIMLQGVFDEDLYTQLKAKKIKKAFVLEGRPSLESAKHTSKELLKRKIKPVLISDNMAGFLFAKNMVEEVCLSYQLADDKGAVCQIGGLILGVLGKKHKVPVYLYKSQNRTKFMGKPKDIFYFQNERIAPKGIRAYVPLVEWVPKKYIKKRYE